MRRQDARLRHSLRVCLRHHQPRRRSRVPDGGDWGDRGPDSDCACVHGQRRYGPAGDPRRVEPPQGGCPGVHDAGYRPGHADLCGDQPNHHDARVVGVAVGDARGLLQHLAPHRRLLRRKHSRGNGRGWGGPSGADVLHSRGHLGQRRLGRRLAHHLMEHLHRGGVQPLNKLFLFVRSHEPRDRAALAFCDVARGVECGAIRRARNAERRPPSLRGPQRDRSAADRRSGVYGTGLHAVVAPRWVSQRCDDGPRRISRLANRRRV
mmetsp:Transcript_54556/g.129589  ORF Transcript_54556/g.129589 Transcript_54556/m.129589 type:complete len:264 (-) Transcript_54556:3014-3805(-)